MYFKAKTVFKVLIQHGPRDAAKFMRDYMSISREIKLTISEIIKRNAIENPGVAFQKYLDVNHWVCECLWRAYNLDIHNSTRKMRVLDIGTGAGYFPYVCRYYGHEVEAIDVPDNEMYNDIVRALGIRRHHQKLEALHDLCVSARYDLITGFMICFNNHNRSNVWHVEQWDYFLKSIISNNLLPKGRIFLSMNPEKGPVPVHRDLIEFFRRSGADVNGLQVSIAL